MKKILLLLQLILCLSAQSAFSQTTYFVLNVKGIVKIKKTGKILKINDQLSDKETLSFTSINDVVAVISTKNGRMILKPKQTAKSSELYCVLSEILNPGTGRLSSRSGSITNSIELENFFEKDSLYILGSTKKWISPIAFPMNQENFFFVRYTWKGETINKKLLYYNDSININKEDLYKVDGKNISPDETTNPTLYYKKGASTSQICLFTISFPNESKTKEIVTAFKQHKTSKGEDFIGELLPLLKDIYGKTEIDNVRWWVRKNIGAY